MLNYMEYYDTLKPLAKAAFNFYFPVMKALAPLILLLVIVKGTLDYTLFRVNNEYVSAASQIIFFLFVLGILTLMIYHAMQIIQKNKSADNGGMSVDYSLKNSFYITLQRWPQILLVVLVLLGILFGIGLLANKMISHFHITSDVGLIVVFVFIGIFVMAVMFYFFFVIPLILSGFAAGKAVILGGRLVGHGTFRLFILFFLVILLFVFLAPSSEHGVWLRQHYLLPLYDFVILVICLPWLLNFILFNFYDLLRLEQEARED